jgi:hypothetical protein
MPLVFEEELSEGILRKEGPMNRSIGGSLRAAAFSFATWLVPAALAAQSHESYHFSAGSIEAGDNGFADRWCGPDMLPYTADDIELPAFGNPAGTWCFSWIDQTNDRVVDDDDHIFNLSFRRNDGDDDLSTFVAPFTQPQHGVLKEGEYFFDLHDARNDGPSRDAPDGTVDPHPGNDFEHNDRGGNIDGVGQPGFEGANNYFWYNNDRANQRGWGGSKYYLEQKNSGDNRLDEIEGFYHWVTFQNNADDPGTPAFDESGACDRDYMRSADAVFRGLLIPVADIPGLQNGELDPLFGWYAGDMATYVRDILGPKLSDPTLTVTMSSEDCAASESAIDPTHVLILQTEVPIAINGTMVCGDQNQAEAMAGYWGITPTTPGEPATTAVYRTSSILLFNDALTQVPNPPFETEATGTPRNIWVHDAFWRNDRNRVGRYTLGSTWTFETDSSLDIGCSNSDMFFRLAPATAGFFQAPLDAALDTAAGAVYAVADVGNVDVPPPIAAGAGGGLPEAVYQIILMSGNEVLAYAEFGASGSSVNVGGTLDANGLATGPTRTQAGAQAEVPLVDPLASEFSRYVLRAGPFGIQLSEAAGAAFDSNDFVDLDGFDVLASLSPGVGEDVTAVRFATSGGDDTRTVAADTFAVLQNLDPDVQVGGIQKPNDMNQDGLFNLSDPVATLNHLFVGGQSAPPPCGDNTVNHPGNKALLDSNMDGSINLSDPIFDLNFLFSGGPRPVACSDNSCPCIVIPDCPANAAGDCAP